MKIFKSVVTMPRASRTTRPTAANATAMLVSRAMVTFASHSPATSTLTATLTPAVSTVHQAHTNASAIRALSATATSAPLRAVTSWTTVARMASVSRTCSRNSTGADAPMAMPEMDINVSRMVNTFLNNTVLFADQVELNFLLIL